MSVSPEGGFGAPPAIWFRSLLQKNGLTPSDEQIGQVEKFVELLLDWNSKVNLISRKDTENVWQAHILHSASILLLTEIPQNAKVLDLGSGGGLPGVVIKILRPDTEMTCLDATRKKMEAVADMISQLGLSRCGVSWGRAENLGKTHPHRFHYDTVLARAVAPLRDLVRWSRPFLRQTESFPQPDSMKPTRPTLIALKGGDLERERSQASSLPGVGSVRESALVFHGAEQIPGVDKKIVIVEFDQTLVRRRFSDPVPGTDPELP